jgi:hypothetical protein
VKEVDMSRYQFDQQVEVTDIPLGESSTLHVTLVPTTDGGVVVGVREWVSSERYAGPTRKGVLIPPGLLDTLISALRSAEERLGQLGMDHGHSS